MLVRCAAAAPENAGSERGAVCERFREFGRFYLENCFAVFNYGYAGIRFYENRDARAFDEFFREGSRMVEVSAAVEPDGK